MVGAILVSLGHSAADAVNLIKTQRPRANPSQWYIRERIVRFERRWKSPRTERSDYLLKLGLEALTHQDLPRAARTIRLAISANPRNADAWAAQADIMARGGRAIDSAHFKAGEGWLRAAAEPISA
jgi:hypothetical protein